MTIAATAPQSDFSTLAREIIDLAKTTGTLQIRSKGDHSPETPLLNQGQYNRLWRELSSEQITELLRATISATTPQELAYIALSLVDFNPQLARPILQREFSFSVSERAPALHTMAYCLAAQAAMFKVGSKPATLEAGIKKAAANLQILASRQSYSKNEIEFFSHWLSAQAKELGLTVVVP